MICSKCYWDGNLDNGRLRRCKDHAKLYKLERDLNRRARKWVRIELESEKSK